MSARIICTAALIGAYSASRSLAFYLTTDCINGVVWVHMCCYPITTHPAFYLSMLFSEWKELINWKCLRNIYFYVHSLVKNDSSFSASFNSTLGMLYTYLAFICCNMLCRMNANCQVQGDSKACALISKSYPHVFFVYMDRILSFTIRLYITLKSLACDCPCPASHILRVFWVQA